ncbi:MAG: sulfite exporter TauE/SafE family protein [Proteobacteria bacterium]|nr:sulfite exporter TauE/SafE family protein [Pseudomonadota bacterium]MBU1388416.1 sulfite exporter TauE/SafE family protein [Pseudomonadota bacterium]MBU1542760.1 sulfite exporter TauE/SafE family protein [Pseudomonadota bacterium]MBU2482157.1 sulfite exporter TauE/SafE family protein [Pseudomonadota bacterium]
MELIIVCLAALAASLLTLFSGFGLGTLLMPVIALFFSLELAIAMTAMVHLANNLFKIGLLGKKADCSILIKFGLPAVLAALGGAFLLAWFGNFQPVHEYQAFGHDLQISALKLIIGCLIIVFVALELWPAYANIAIDRKWLPLGGVISGFFGGLSGHQGAFRSMFLIKAGLQKEVFVATGVVLAVMVDFSRLAIYGTDILMRAGSINWGMVISASLSAFAGAYMGKRILGKVTIRTVQLLVSAALTVIAIGLIAGVL